MKWGKLPGDDRDLLFWVLWFAIQYYSDVSLEKLLKRFFTHGSGLLGDPGWEFEFLRNEVGYESYDFSADVNFSGIEPAHMNYSAEIVREALKDSLLALADKEPTKADEVVSLIIKYGL
ncbi:MULTISPECIES: hypothetical protein [Pseudomonas syringae group]|uniref:Uncharacterized protein n=2 Tax=Pseudomonas syringae group TaxID=136849 RepID=A0A7Z6ULP3_PSESF|nr:MULTISPECIES: hypothetical protein [Pseudomonas syringae group]KTC62345.1 hypothetical protein AO287_26125 [Pseudomonas savastanoi]MDU8458551.1 hypothetical protein [Pseudomonas syringae group sp. J254-4]MDU8542146.1 hypothetical protein [Pseudomonas syringae group sp. J248-6]MDU8606383.1 hypothetical protein [Pseudomonas syringae group sp. 247E2]RMP81932.1 hypothetical protein ALQ15_112583 [Pseudomonas syringae pv. actinidiae]